MLRFLVRFSLLILLVGAAGAVAAGWAWQRFTGPGPLAQERTVVVERGSGVNAIARQLAEAGVLPDPWTFRIGTRLFGEGRLLKAGEYRFEAHISPQAVLEKLAAGDVVQRQVTVPEGLTTAQVIELLAAVDGLTGEIGAPRPEGELLPETYAYTLGDSREELIGRMRSGMDAVLAELWPKRAAGLPLKSPEEAVTLASIVEKETGVAAERPRVAAVFVNRLTRGMPLQSDPTVIYALTDGKSASVANGEGILGRKLTRADLDADHPYNTYRIPGLPPGPIANPGRASLEAVLNPPATKELYFVADGSGGHAFAATLEEHNRNVARWRKLQNGAQ
ncbi:MAG TPA: endolytic transglycosylase MltG [Alphaproteobacteria bacterium]|nr:endolytic transglycosylase MltG [Alphaproteobacteria bacterium]